MTTRSIEASRPAGIQVAGCVARTAAAAPSASEGGLSTARWSAWRHSRAPRGRVEGRWRAILPLDFDVADRLLRFLGFVGGGLGGEHPHLRLQLQELLVRLLRRDVHLE